MIIRRRGGWRWLAVALVFLSAPTLPGQQVPGATSPDTAVPQPRPIPLDSIPERGSATQALVAALRARVPSDSVLRHLDATLRQVRASFARDSAGVSPEQLDRMIFDALVDVEGDWIDLRRRHARWREQVAGVAARVDGMLDTLSRIQERWQLTRTASWREAPATVREQITSIRQQTDSALRELRPVRERLLAMQGAGSQLDVDIGSVVEEIRTAQGRARRQLLRRDSPFLWQVVATAGADSVPAIPAGAEAPIDTFESAAGYLLAHPGRVGVHAVLFLVVAVVLWLVSRRRATWATAEFALHWPSELLAHPVAAAALAAMALTRAVYPNAPRGVFGLAFLLFLPGLLILLRRLLGPTLRGPAVVLLLLYAVRVVAETFAWNPIAARFALLTLAAAAAATMLWFARLLLEEVRASSGASPWMRGGRVLLYVGAASEIVAVAANVFGFVSLSNVLMVGALVGAWTALGLVALSEVLISALLVIVLASPIRRLQILRRNRALTTRRITTLVNVGALLFWLSVVSRGFRVDQPVQQVLSSIVTAPLEVGSWSFSVGDVLLFLVTLWLTVHLARGLRAVLRDDVLARMDVDRGVPDAVASIAYYVALAFGFVFAAGAAGVEFGRLALIAGALGVGIGFGLQTIVANFISGLILLFERPIQTGDTLELEGLRGVVQQIGIRASTVRTFQGADVIVPNQDLIAQRVINWTLSDQTRRLEIPIGVAYGSDPVEVITLVRELAAKHPKVLPRPEVTVFFTAFGESSLDFELRLWTSIDDWVEVRSDVLVAVYQAFAERGIEIPFPQRDLHVRSIEPDVRDLLRKPST